MNREYPDRPFVGVGAIIVDHRDAEKGRVALIKRGHAPAFGEWSIPGGTMEVGETVREAVVREVLEETGLIVESGALLGVFDRLLRDPDGRTQYHYVLIDFECTCIGGEFKAGGDAAEARWFTAEEVAKLPLPEDTAEVIRRGLKNRP
ncbi:MAG TPA: NUDIX hydrolase [Terriglobales bacterium]|jgi:ADP-ribose pyrophosphatase YjhB (NUDIX family)